MKVKKTFIALALALTGFAGFSQVLQQPGVQNYLWTGMGVPAGTPNSSERAGFRWYGFIDTVQVRADIYKFTLDGMLSWGALTEWTDNSISDFTFINTARKPEHFLHTNNNRVDNNDSGRRSNAYNKGDGTYGNDSYYLNFLYHPIEGLDFGMGTRLEWQVGPNPSYGAYPWEFNAHVHQGDLRDGTPGSVPVAGYIKYANTYAQKALGLRYRYKNIFEIGASIPSGFTTHSPVVNFGVEVTPVEFITAAFAYEALFMDDSNLYTGATININNLFILDAYLAFENLGNNFGNYGRWGTGAAITLSFEKIGLTIRPEVGFTEYGNSDYTFAFFTGGKVNLNFAERCHLGCWLSFAWGAENSKWHDDRLLTYQFTKDYNGGFIFNIRPEFAFDINKNHTVAFSAEFESLTDYKHDVVDSLLFGFYWRYKSK